MYSDSIDLRSNNAIQIVMCTNIHTPEDKLIAVQCILFCLILFPTVYKYLLTHVLIPILTPNQSLHRKDNYKEIGMDWRLASQIRFNEKLP